MLSVLRRTEVDAAIHRQYDSNGRELARESEQAIRTVEAMAASHEELIRQLRGYGPRRIVTEMALTDADAPRQRNDPRTQRPGGIPCRP